jgi:hypothetical protein
MTNKRVTLEEVLEERDFGLIISSDGFLKGIWVPKEFEGEDIPKPIATLIRTNFGVDPNDSEVYRKIH